MKARNRAVEREPEVGEASRSIIKQTTAVLPIRTDAFASDEIDCVIQSRYAVKGALVRRGFPHHPGFIQ